MVSSFILNPAFLFVKILLSIQLITCGRSEPLVHSYLAKKDGLPLQFPDALTVAIGQETPLLFSYKKPLKHDLSLLLNASWTTLKLEPKQIVLNKGKNAHAWVNVTGLSLTSRTYIDVINCSERENGTVYPCPFDQSKVFVSVAVVRSNAISILVQITGWIYFFAWSISFYPQIILNFQRKSVVGLNFDFLLLNVIGFTCYTVYNILMYFDTNIQEIYIERHGQRSLIPVLINDVVFASHALIACIITGFQCFIYERGTQRISYICRGWASLLLFFSFVSLILAIFHVLNWLDFINYLSYAKMGVTLSKYFPQSILNFKRKSTVGWSIGNVLLDFTGGFMDICQMCLQAINSNDWSAFSGNPVKFGLGLVSMIFDVLFIIQHYVLYRQKEESSTYDQVDASDPAPSIPSPPADAVSPPPQCGDAVPIIPF